MRYFTIPPCRIFSENSENIPGQRMYECGMLGQKLGYDNEEINVGNEFVLANENTDFATYLHVRAPIYVRLDLPTAHTYVR